MGELQHQAAGQAKPVAKDPPARPRPAGGASRALHVLALQRQAGNRAVAQHIANGGVPVQRNWLSDAADWVGDTVRGAASAVGDAAEWVGDRVGDALDIRENEELKDYQEDRAALRAFKQQGLRGPRNLRAPTGIGGFGAAYDPRAEQMMVRLAGGVTFTDSIRFQGDIAMISHPNPGKALVQFIARVNGLPAAQRRAAAAPYLWTAAERTSFVTTFNAGVRDRWTGRYEFHTTRENWTDLGATVDVTSQMHAGAKAEDEHVSLTVYKTPPGGAGSVGVVRSSSGGATDNAMVLNSPDAAPRADNLLQWTGTFPPDATALDAEGEVKVNEIGSTFRGGGPGCRICGVTITASSGGPALKVHVGGATEAAARNRYRNIVSTLIAGGNFDIALRTEFEHSGAGDGYRVVAGNGLAQSVGEHEAGHMFGLGDEYATGDGSKIKGTGAAAGGESKHDELVKDMGLEGSVFENNDGIMSLGSVVRPQHYATFHWALGELTDIEWALGPPVPVTAPPGAQMGDFPEPDRSTAMA